MIKTLHISNYALIDRIDITFFPGLNIITGETGAGKSIILGALGLLLGGRADTKVVRDPDVKLSSRQPSRLAATHRCSNSAMKTI